MKCLLTHSLDKTQSIALLSLRLMLAYGFYTPAMTKFGNISNVADWFATLGIPLPLLNAYLAASTEALGVLLLTIGLGTRLIAVPLMMVMVVAIVTVHLPHGFSAADNGFEIPFYYLLMLFVLASHGSGKFSIDAWIEDKACDDASVI